MADPISPNTFPRVLLVEDEPSHAQLVRRALRGVVGEISVATTGKAGLEAAVRGDEPPDLIFSDLNLPDITGFEVLKGVLHERDSVPIVVMTSSSRLEDAVTAMQAGAWDYVVKQFDDNFQNRLQIVVTRCAERKLALEREQKLRAERDAFWSAVRAASDGVALVDDEGKLLFANETFDALLTAIARETGAEASRRNLRELFLSLNERLGQELGEELRSTERKLWRSELRLKGASDDDPLYYEVTLSTISAGEGRLGGHVLWSRDITLRKEQEKFQRDLLATTSHDLKGPLGAIITSTELLLTQLQPDGKRTVELVTRMGSCARNCISLIDELLSARRIQDGVLVIKPRWGTVDEYTEDLILDYQTSARAKNISLSFEPDERGLKIYADKLAYQRMVGNLVSNALKFTPKGGRVRITACRSKTECWISVEDNGCGIETEQFHSLFDRYTRLDKHQEVGGTGLGLFVTKSLVDAHGGRVEIRSQVGAGTTFRLVFPDPMEERVSPS